MELSFRLNLHGLLLWICQYTSIQCYSLAVGLLTRVHYHVQVSIDLSEVKWGSYHLVCSAAKCCGVLSRLSDNFREPHGFMTAVSSVTCHRSCFLAICEHVCPGRVRALLAIWGHIDLESRHLQFTRIRWRLLRVDHSGTFELGT